MQTSGTTANNLGFIRGGDGKINHFIPIHSWTKHRSGDSFGLLTR